MTEGSLEGSQFQVVDSFLTVLESAPINEGDVFEVTEDPISYDIGEEMTCIEVIHESMVGRKDPVYGVVKRAEFVEKTEEV